MREIKIKRKRAVSFLLALVMLLGFVPSLNIAHASNTNDLDDQLSYEIREINGRLYKAYQVSDLNLRDPRKLVRSESTKPKEGFSLYAVGDALPSNYKAVIDWSFMDLTTDDFPGLKLEITVFENGQDYIIAETDPLNIQSEGITTVTFKEREHYETYKSRLLDWELLIPEFFELDIRVAGQLSGNFRDENVTLIAKQRANPLYKAIWYTNQSMLPTVKATFTDKNDSDTNLTLNNDLTISYAKNEFDSVSNEKGVIFYDGDEVTVKNYGTLTPEWLEINQIENSAERIKVHVLDSTGSKTRKGVIDHNGIKFHYIVDGDYKTAHITTLREELEVTFDANKATFGNEDLGKAQPIGHSMKVGESFGDLAPVKIPGADDIKDIPKSAQGLDQEFKGWALKADATESETVNVSEQVITQNTTFYAVYGPKAQGKADVQYVDESGATIDAKYQLKGQEYPTEISGNDGDTVTYDGNNAPKFLGYKYNTVEIAGTDKKYTDPATTTIKVKYKKLPPIIPGTDPTNKTKNDKPEGYKTVQFKPGDHGTLTGETTFYVNPVEGITLAEVKSPKITPDPGYVVASPNWKPDYVTTTKITKDSDEKKLIFTAQYDYLTYKITVATNDNGELKDPTQNTIDVKSSETWAQVKAKAEALVQAKLGNKLKDWTFTKDGTDVIADDYKFAASKTIFANFIKDDGQYVKVQFAADDAGKVTLTNTKKQDVLKTQNLATSGVTEPALNTDYTITKGYKVSKWVAADGTEFAGTITPTTDMTFKAVVEVDQAVNDFKGKVNYYVAGTTDLVPGITPNPKEVTGYIGQVVDITPHPTAPAGYELVPSQPTTITIKEDNTAEVNVYYSKLLEEVKYVFKSEDTSLTLPEEVLAQLPNKVYDGVTMEQVGKTITPPDATTFKAVVTNEGIWEFKAWDPATITVEKGKGPYTITGTWTFSADIIGPVDPTVTTNPDSNEYWTVTYKPGDHGQFTDGKTTYYVKKDAKKTLGDLKNKPDVKEDDGWKFIGWDLVDTTPIDQDLTVNAKYKTKVIKLDDPDKPTNFPQDPKKPGTPDKDYVTVKFIAGENGSLEGGNVAYAVLNNITWKDAKVNGMVIPNPVANEKYAFADWNPELLYDSIIIQIDRTFEARFVDKTKNQGYFYEPSPDYLNKNTPKREETREERKQEKYLLAYRWYVKGNELGQFMPTKGITRAEVAQMFARALEYDKTQTVPTGKTYTDVRPDAWYKDAVEKTTSAGIFKGSDKGTFMPEREITKAELIATIARYQKLNTKPGNTMNLKENHWATTEVEAAYQEGWLDIYTQGIKTFNADEKITREEVVTILNRAFGRKADKEYIDKNAHVMTTFTDITKDMWSYYEIITASNTYLEERNWTNHATRDNGPEMKVNEVEWIRPLIDNNETVEIVEQVRFQR